MKSKIWMAIVLMGMALLVGCSTDEDEITPPTGPPPDEGPELYINEFMADNENSYADENGEFDDWIEIYNDGSEAVDVGGMFITDDLTDFGLWQIPTTAPSATTIQPGGFLILWADKETDQGELHVNIKLSGDGEAVGLIDSDGITVIDSVSYGLQSTNVSYGRIPDGGSSWELLLTPTPGLANNNGEPQVILFINEFLASNDTSIEDENGEFDDWVEIYNAGVASVNLAGKYLTDNHYADGLEEWYLIPDTDEALTTIEPGGFLLFWFDSQPEQGVMHVSQKLGSGGDGIYLIDDDAASVMDSLTYEAQTTDVSYGRIPDGSDIWEFFETPTPGESNQ